MKRIELIISKLSELNHEKESLEKSLDINQKTVMTFAEHNETIKRSLERVFFISNMYSNINQSELEKLTDPEFN